MSGLAYFWFGVGYLVLYAIGGWLLQGHPLARSIFGNAGLLVRAGPGVRRHPSPAPRLERLPSPFLGHVRRRRGALGGRPHRLGCTRTSCAASRRGCDGTRCSASAAVLDRSSRSSRARTGARVPRTPAPSAWWWRATASSACSSIRTTCWCRAWCSAPTRTWRCCRSCRSIARCSFSRRLPRSTAPGGRAWRATFTYLTIATGLGLALRFATNIAILHGTYHTGALYDLAWIAPYLLYAYGALAAPDSASDVRPLARRRPCSLPRSRRCPSC